MRHRFFGSHEAFARKDAVRPSSDRKFGLVLAGFFGLLAALSIWHGTARWPYWAGAAIVVLILGLAMPRSLAPFNRLWTKLGLVLHEITAPIVLGLIFYLCITPVGFLMRLFGTDPLRRRYDPEAKSYWIKRVPAGPGPDTFKNQF